MGQERIIYACDVGSTRCSPRTGIPSFAWARLNPEDKVTPIEGSFDIEKLVQRLGSDIRHGCSIALGFEAPLFIPIPNASHGLSKSRIGEGNPSFACQVGLAVSTLAIHQSAWILNKLRNMSSGRYRFSLDMGQWPPSGSIPVLFCWEAFVSGKAHGEEGIRDAATAVSFFRENEANLENVNAVSAENPLSLIGAVALWSGWVSDLAYVHKPTLVIRPKEPFMGGIQKLD